MAFEKGHKHGKGRIKGSQNRRTRMVEDIASKYDLDPFEVLMKVVNADWEGLGYPAQTYEEYGKEFSNTRLYITPEDRIQAAKDACAYLYAKKQALKIDINNIQKMSDEEFTKFKEEFMKQYVPNDE